MAKIAGTIIVAVFLVVLGDYQPDRKQSQQSSMQQPSAMPNSAASPRLEFEVAVIKPGVPSETDAGVKPDPGGQTYRAQNMPLQLMIRLMWKLNDTQVVGGPDWLTKDFWDIEAKADRPRSLDDLHTMFQNMIIDRYNMKFHWDTRDLPIYALVQDKSRERMKLNTNPEPFGSYPILGTSFGRLKAEHCDMAYFTWFLSR